MRSLLLALALFGAAAANQYYHGTPPPELGPSEFEVKPYCCNVVENVMAELKERVAKSGGNALKLKEILDHCIKKLLTIKTALVKQIETFDSWVKKNGVPERIGAPGDKGDTGPKGLAGIDGQKGQKGEPGRKGLVGSQGHPGRMGRKGDVGATGNPGAKGDKGVQGQTTYVRGAKGVPGAVGNAGPPGPQGPRGPIGPRGAKGVTGEQGNIGPQGWCLRDSHKQCKPNQHPEDEEDPYKHHPEGEPKPEPELIPNPADFEAPDEKHVYYGTRVEEPAKDPEYCPSCGDPEP